MHDSLAPVAPLVGTWHGTGVASYPTMQGLAYADELVFSDIGKPFLAYSQRTWTTDGLLMHVESGYLRVIDGDQVEFVVAIPTGQSEIGLGELTVADGDVYISTDAAVRTTPTAKRVDRIVRSYAYTHGTLTYDMAMDAVGVGLTAHLHATLTQG